MISRIPAPQSTPARSAREVLEVASSGDARWTRSLPTSYAPFLASVALTLSVVFGFGGASFADEGDGFETEVDEEFEDDEIGDRGRQRERFFGGFEPYLSTGPFTTIQRAKSDISTNFGLEENPANVLTNLGWLFELGLRTPAVEALPGDPKFLLTAGLMIPMNESATLGSSIDIIEVNSGQANLSRGAKMSLEYDEGYKFGAGAEFGVEVFDVDVTLTPGISYVYLDGRWAAATRTILVSLLAGVEPIESRSFGKNSFIQHLLGPSLRIGTESIDVGVFRVDLFLEGSLLVDLTGTREQSRTFDPDAGAGQLSVFTWETDPIGGSFTAGARIRIP